MSQGRFFYGGPAEAGVQRAWSATVVSSPGVADGIAYVVDAAAAAIAALREDATLAVDSVSGELFDRNQVRVRCESRLLLGVTGPQAIVKADISA
jgi:hypothetical protein